MPYAKPNKKQGNFFGDNESWKDEWKDMPEFIQENILPMYSVRINFKDAEDMRKFRLLIGQPITPKTDSIWYPEQEAGNFINKKYVDET